MIHLAGQRTDYNNISQRCDNVFTVLGFPKQFRINSLRIVFSMRTPPAISIRCICRIHKLGIVGIIKLLTVYIADTCKRRTNFDEAIQLLKIDNQMINLSSEIPFCGLSFENNEAYIKVHK